jgi:hypothetical protein
VELRIWRPVVPLGTSSRLSISPCAPGSFLRVSMHLDRQHRGIGDWGKALTGQWTLGSLRPLRPQQSRLGWSNPMIRHRTHLPSSNSSCWFRPWRVQSLGYANNRSEHCVLPLLPQFMIRRDWTKAYCGGSHDLMARHD